MVFGLEMRRQRLCKGKRSSWDPTAVPLQGPHTHPHRRTSTSPGQGVILSTRQAEAHYLHLLLRNHQVGQKKRRLKLVVRQIDATMSKVDQGEGTYVSTHVSRVWNTSGSKWTPGDYPLLVCPASPGVGVPLRAMEAELRGTSWFLLAPTRRNNSLTLGLPQKKNGTWDLQQRRLWGHWGILHHREENQARGRDQEKEMGRK